MSSAWPIRNLVEVLEIQNGYAFDSKGFNPTEGMPLIRIRNLKTGTETETRFAGNYDKKYVVNNGDLLIGMDGEFCCYEWKGGAALLNQRVCRLQGFKSDLLPRFLFYGVNSHLKAIEDITGFATVKHISSKQILGIKFSLPPLQEQQRIVAILDQAFEGIAKARTNAEQNLQNARALFESHLQSVFTQSGEGWRILPLAQLSERITKGSSPKWQGINYVDKGGILFVTSENVGENEILLKQPKFVESKFNDKEKKSILKRGDVLTNIVGASIGRTAIYNLDEVANINQAVCLIRCEPKLLNNSYLTYLLNSPVFKQILHDNEVDNARANLSLGFFANLEIPLPSLDIQKSIVEKLDVFRYETQRLEALYQRKIALLDELKKSLLQQAFAGEL